MPTAIAKELPFLSGGGDAGARLRAKDWSNSPLGLPVDWPRSLKMAVRLMLTTGHPLSIFWGPQAIWLFNDARGRSIGTERRATAMGQPGSLVWPETWAVIGPQVAQVMAGEGSTWHENALVPIFRDGKFEDAYWTYSYGPIDDEDAATGVGGVLVIGNETTQQILAQKRAVTQTARLARLFDQSPSYIAVTEGPEHRIEFVNPNFNLLMGGRVATGKMVLEAVPDAADKGYLERLDGVFSTGQATAFRGLRFAVEVTRGGGVEDRYLDFVYQPIVDDLGGVTGVFVEGVDVTARTGSEEALRQAEAQLRAVLQAIPGVVYAKDREGRMLVANKGVVDLVGKALEAIIGKTDLEFLEDKLQAAAIMETDRRIMDSGESEVLEEAVSLPDGAPTIWLSTKTPVRDAAGDVVGLIGSSVDFTDQRRAREILTQSRADLEREVAERTAALIAAEDQLRQAQKMEAVGQLTGGIAHDFNNLLAGITLSLELLETRIADGRLDTAKRYIDSAQGAARRAAALTQRLLAFSRRQTLDPKAVDVDQLVGGMMELIERSMGPTIELSVREASEPWLTRIDPNQLENALLNLCINARDAMPDGGRLSIETKTESLHGAAARRLDLEPADYVTLAVADTGCGMSPDVAQRAFDPFFNHQAARRGDRARPVDDLRLRPPIARTDRDRLRTGPGNDGPHVSASGPGRSGGGFRKAGAGAGGGVDRRRRNRSGHR